MKIKPLIGPCGKLPILIRDEDLSGNVISYKRISLN